MKKLIVIIVLFISGSVFSQSYVGNTLNDVLEHMKNRDFKLIDRKWDNEGYYVLSFSRMDSEREYGVIHFESTKFEGSKGSSRIISKGVVVTMKNKENIFRYFGQSFKRFIGPKIQRNEYKDTYGLAKTAYFGDIEWTNGTYRWFATFRF